LRRWLAVAGWVVGSVALGAVLLRISLGAGVDSDGANNVLQAWDLLHGNLLLHDWIIGDANFYFLELPLNAITEAVFGVGNFAAHAGSALTYLLVIASAVALGMADSRGAAKAVRCAVVIMLLAAPLLAVSVRFLLEEPDHIGTSVFVLGSFLLIDRVPARRFAAPLVCVILCAGQFGDLTVRYVAVPAVVLVCGYRALAARRLRSSDAAMVVAAVASVPLDMLLSTVMVHLGGFTGHAPKASFAPVRLWMHQAAITWSNLRLLFGAVHGKGAKLGAAGFDFRMACLLAAIAGLAWAMCRWWRVSRAEQLLCAAIVFNVGIALTSVLATPGNAHELAVVLPCGAVLAARLVPARIPSVPVAFAAVAVTGVGAVLALASAVTVPQDPGFSAPLTSWLETHGLTYGLAAYWDAPAATVQSGDRVMVITANLGERWPTSRRETMNGAAYEDERSWYDPSLHDATFVIADGALNFPVTAIEEAFGKPVTSYRLDQWTILIYRKNLLSLLGGASRFSSLSVGGGVAPLRQPPPDPVREVAEHRGGRRERRHRADDRQGPRDSRAERAPAAGQAAGETGRRLRLGVLDHRLRLRPEDGHRDRGVCGLVVQRALLRLQRLQVRLLVVDLLLHGEQVGDRAGVLEQRPQLSDRRLVGGDPAVDVGHLLGHVLRLLLEGQLRAKTGGQLAQRRGVHRHRDLDLDGRGGLVWMARVAARVLRRDVAARAGDDGRRAGDSGADAGRPHGELRGVDELLVRGRQPRGSDRLRRAGGGASGGAGRRVRSRPAAGPVRGRGRAGAGGGGGERGPGLGRGALRGGACGPAARASGKHGHRDQRGECQARRQENSRGRAALRRLLRGTHALSTAPPPSPVAPADHDCASPQALFSSRRRPS
jgi:hypothetical protein